MSMEYTSNEVKLDVGEYAVNQLVGQILTQIDAIAADETQRKALKDIFKSLIWDWAYRFTPRGEASGSGGIAEITS